MTHSYAIAINQNIALAECDAMTRAWVKTVVATTVKMTGG
jgi:hypothetical protein